MLLYHYLVYICITQPFKPLRLMETFILHPFISILFLALKFPVVRSVSLNIPSILSLIDDLSVYSNFCSYKISTKYTKIYLIQNIYLFEVDSCYFYSFSLCLYESGGYLSFNLF